jgi:GNAT superfamily N-acetyltransferase
MNVVIRPFERRDQDAARRIILDGLGEHFGSINEEVNEDLADIGSSYAADVFLVAECDGILAGTGALVYEGEGIARVQRMSVRRDLRRQGTGSALLDGLIEHARSLGCWRVVLETGDWPDSIGFYRSRGFVQTSHDGHGPNMALDL